MKLQIYGAYFGRICCVWWYRLGHMTWNEKRRSLYECIACGQGLGFSWSFSRVQGGGNGDDMGEVWYGHHNLHLVSLAAG
jgi:hypothetical protein